MRPCLRFKRGAWHFKWPYFRNIAMDIILYQPEIPPNTGNIIRLCANVGMGLHLIKPLGFDLSDKQLNRAGLDYHDLAHVVLHESWTACAAAFEGRRLFALSTRGKTRYDSVAYTDSDAFIFGPETRGLPGELLSTFPEGQCLRIPMCPNNRSLNLSNTAAIVAYEAWRQLNFAGGA